MALITFRLQQYLLGLWKIQSVVFAQQGTDTQPCLRIGTWPSLTGSSRVGRGVGTLCTGSCKRGSLAYPTWVRPVIHSKLTALVPTTCKQIRAETAFERFFKQLMWKIFLSDVTSVVTILIRNTSRAYLDINLVVQVGSTIQRKNKCRFHRFFITKTATGCHDSPKSIEYFY